MADLFDTDLTELLSGRCQWYIAPYATTLPTRIADIVGQVSPYTPVTGWRKVGSTTAASTYTRAITTGGQNIQQTNTVVLREITDVSRVIAGTIAEMSEENLTLFENSPGSTSVTAAANKSAETQIPVGSISELDTYRVAIIGRYRKNEQLVTEPGGKLRGAMLGFVGFNASLSGDSSAVSFDAGGLLAMPISVTLDPDSAVTESEEAVGMWVREHAGTIAAT